MEKSKKRVVYFDILNIIAIVAVVALHCNGIIHSNPNVKAWNTSLIMECIFYFAVPLFFMLSGAKLIPYREKYDTKTFFKKRVVKVLIPFMFWIAFMFVWKIKIKALDLQQLQTVKDWLNAFLTNKEEGTYYFLFDILGLYITIPLLSLLTKNEYRKTLWFTILIYFVFNAFFPNVLELFGIKYNMSLSLQIGGYCIYALLGYLLSIQNIEKKYRIVIYIGAIIGSIYRYTTTFILSKEAGQVIKTTWGYTSWHCILLTSAVFLLVKNSKVEELLKGKDKIVNILAKIANCSFGVYLIHLIIKYYEIKLLNLDIYTWQFRTFGIISTYLISLAIVYVLKKIPIIKKIVA